MVQGWDLAVRRIIPGSIYHRFASRFLFWLSSFTNPRINVRVLIIWGSRIWWLVIWIHYTGFHMCPRFYCGPQKAHHLECSLDHCRVPRSRRLYQGLLHLSRAVWGVSWRSTPKSAAVIVFKFGAASLVVTRFPLLFIEANTIFTLSGCFPHLWSYMELGCKYLAVCVRTHSFAWYILLRAHDLKRPRVVKEYFMGLVV